MKNIKRLLASLMVVVMLLTTAPMSGFAELDLTDIFKISASAQTYTGTCGDNLTWTFNTETGELSIDGTGAMYDYDCNNRPWESYEDQIKTVTIGNSVTAIGDFAFTYCESLTSIEVDADNEYYSSDSFGVLYNKDKTELIQYLIGNERTEFTIPDSVTSIGDLAFRGCESLTSVTIPDSVTTIGNHAFVCCYSLTSITIPDSVTRIGDSVFWDCDSLTSIIIPDSVTSIGDLAFGNCYSLTSITIPDSVTTIGDYAFDNCRSLTSITIPDSVTSIGDAAFWACNSLTDVYYSGTYEDWQKISIGIDNECLKNAIIHYDLVAPDIPQSAVVKENLDYYIEEDDAHKKLSMQTTLKDEWFSEDSEVYNHELGGFCSQFTVLGYTKASHKLTDEQKKNGTRPAGYITKNQVLKNALNKMGFSDPVVELSAPREEVNHFIANKKININSEEYTLIFMGFIGSYQEQWYSNFDPGTGETHAGFKGAAKSMLWYLDDYLKDMNVDKNKTKIVITGHSRGAATANLVAAELIKNGKYALKENIYTYAFATPNSTTLPEKDNVVFNRIFNIVNPEDFVTKCLPSAWDYGRYGVTYTLPSKTNTSSSAYNDYLNNMRKYYSQLTNGSKYSPYSDGEAATYNVVQKLTDSVKNVNQFYNKKLEAGVLGDFTSFEFFQVALCPFVSKVATTTEMVAAISLITSVEASTSKVFKGIVNYFLAEQMLNKAFEMAHCAETYCAYMMTMTSFQMTAYPRRGYKNTVNCPVDIEVIDKATGDVVGRIVNNVIDEEIEAKDNAIVMTVDGDSKSFWLPSDGDYDVRLTGNDEGTMDYTVSEIDSDIGEIQRVNFFDVEITDGKEMTGEITGEEFEIDEYTLAFEDESMLLPTEIMSGEDIINYNIDISIEGNGEAGNSMIVPSGDYVSLTATPEEDSEFVGWYEDSVLISTDAQYSFVAKSDRKLTAKFIEVSVSGKVHSVSVDDFSMSYKSTLTISPEIDVDLDVGYKVTYSSSDPSVAYVDDDGYVIALSTGDATITCTVSDEFGNTVTDTCNVEVKYSWWQWIIVIVLFGWIWY